MQVNNLKLLSKFHAARPNRSRAMSKSLKLRADLLKFPSKNKGTRDADVGCSNHRLKDLLL